MRDDRRGVDHDELDPRLAESLRGIERKVMAEVPLRSRAVIAIWVALIVLAGMSAVTALVGTPTPLSQLAVVFGAAAVVLSLAAVVVRRFAVCWVAAAVSAVAIPVSILGYWSDQTARQQTSLGLLVAALCHIALVINWVQCVRPPVGHGSDHAP
ncbi:Rv2732c family membrane protein [Gordonia sputi]